MLPRVVVPISIFLMNENKILLGESHRHCCLSLIITYSIRRLPAMVAELPEQNSFRLRIDAPILEMLLDCMHSTYWRSLEDWNFIHEA